MAKISTLNEENYSRGYDGGSRVSDEVSWIKHASTRKSLRLRICTLGGRRRHRIQAYGLQWFNPWTIFDPCSPSEFFLPKFHDKDGGYIVNNCVKIVAEVDVLEKSDIQVEVEKINRPLRKIEENNGAVPSVLLKEASAVVESLDVNGFQVFPSQVESVRRIFERHPDI
ncbi:MATH domain and coiled-coil domain-containing protein At3g58370-like [Brassica napus]|uniref:MATH domain and coiled-coil domain-containing protein At3g58370-like n=1 Tax=Brassica napus TaxID=3708 RepID=UPI00207A4022|nr:MATH domain and coiled-coil domain-containing protein At3g58370-like [Brassica napus]